MTIILQSEYLTIEFLLWRLCNFDDHFSKAIEQGLLNNSLEIELVNTESRNLISELKIGNEVWILKQFGGQAKSKFIQNENYIYEKKILDNLTPEKVFFDSNYEILITKKLLDFYKLNELFPYLKGKSQWDLINLTTVEIAKIFKEIHNFDASQHKELQKLDADKILKYKSKTDLFEQDYNFLINNWKKTNFIHFDLRTANILQKDNELKILDWEMAVIGDPLWDIAIFLNSLVIDLEPEILAYKSEPLYLNEIQDLLKFFFNEYFNEIPISATEKERLAIFWRLQNINPSDFYELSHYETRINMLLNGI